MSNKCRLWRECCGKATLFRSPQNKSNFIRRQNFTEYCRDDLSRESFQLRFEVRIFFFCTMPKLEPPRVGQIKSGCTHAKASRKTAVSVSDTFSNTKLYTAGRDSCMLTAKSLNTATASMASNGVVANGSS